MAKLDDPVKVFIVQALACYDTPQQVAEKVQELRDLLGFEYLTIFPHLIGDPYAKAVEQMERFSAEVLPLVG